MRSSLQRLIGHAESALRRVEDSLDSPRAFVTEAEADALRRLRQRWADDTDRRIARELGKRYD